MSKVDRFWSHEASNIRCVRESDYDAINAELAALKARQPSGVVLPEPFDMRPFQTIDRGSVNYKAGFNAAIRKVRESLNPCRAQSVPDGYVMVPAVASMDMKNAGWREIERQGIDPESCEMQSIYHAMLAAAQQKESDDE